MLTIEKLNIYEKYSGNGEGFTRFGKKKDKAVLSNDEWYEIEDLLRKLYLVHKGLASIEFESKLNQKLDGRVETPEAKEKIASLARAEWYP